VGAESSAALPATHGDTTHADAVCDSIASWGSTVAVLIRNTTLGATSQLLFRIVTYGTAALTQPNACSCSEDAEHARTNAQQSRQRLPALAEKSTTALRRTPSSGCRVCRAATPTIPYHRMCTIPSKRQVSSAVGATVSAINATSSSTCASTPNNSCQCTASSCLGTLLVASPSLPVDD
jgi:hypothetical protein